MRVIAGFAKGISLKAGINKQVRPTTDRIKESLFNILGSCVDKRVIDLFAGSGSLGIEAISRGAKEAYFFEKNKKTCFIIKKNLLKVLNASTNLSSDLITKVFCLDYKKASQILKNKFDYIFADPPYIDKKLVFSIIRDKKIMALLKNNGQLILEHSEQLVIFDKNEIWQILQQRNFGRTTFSFIGLRK